MKTTETRMNCLNKCKGQDYLEAGGGMSNRDYKIKPQAFCKMKNETSIKPGSFKGTTGAPNQQFPLTQIHEETNINPQLRPSDCKGITSHFNS